MERIKPYARSTARPGAEVDIGGFGALFDLAAAGFKDPVLVAATDGVGTKLKVAIAAGRHECLGIDLVAMCVNDLVVQGAEPLFFLDYFATGRLNAAHAEDVIAGIAAGCHEAGCALIGGETAEMPGLYGGEDFDIAGFAVGAVERGRLLNGEAIAAGDTVLGIPSSGLHANGFSLVRPVVEGSSAALNAPAPFDAKKTLAEALLAPTRIYVKPCLAAHREGLLKGLAHITGGGLSDNIPRVLPDGLMAEIDAGLWTLPPVFLWLAAEGRIAPEEMARTFNCGIGMIAVVAAGDADEAARVLAGGGEKVHTIGRIARRTDKAPGVVVTGAEAVWQA